MSAPGGGDATVVGAAPSRPAAARPSPWAAVLLVALALFTIMALALAVWQLPRTGTLAGLRHDLARGQVRSVEVVTDDGSGFSVGFSSPVRLPNRKPPTPFVHWVSANGQQHDAPLAGTSSAIEGADAGGGSGDEAQLLPRDIQRAVDGADGTGPRVNWSRGHWEAVNNGVGLLFLLVFLLFVAGPATRRGTKWAWWWFISLIPAGVGILVWLALEVPWSRRAYRLPDPLDPLDPLDPASAGLSRRRRWWAGLLAGALVALVLNGLLDAARGRV